ESRLLATPGAFSLSCLGHIADCFPTPEAEGRSLRGGRAGPPRPHHPQRRAEARPVEAGVAARQGHDNTRGPPRPAWGGGAPGAGGGGAWVARGAGVG